MVRLTTNATSVAGALDAAPKVFERKAKLFLRDIMVAFDRKFRKEQFDGYRGRSYSDRLQVRTGSLRNSLVKGEVSGSTLGNMKVETSIGSSASPYARLQEFGGTITPKAKRFLTVPLPGVLTAAGVLKGGARLVNRGGKWQTEDGRQTFIRTSKAGNKYIAASDGAGGIEPLYMLRTSVKVPPRLRFFRTFKDMNKDGTFGRIVSKHVRDGLKEVERDGDS